MDTKGKATFTKGQAVDSLRMTWTNDETTTTLQAFQWGRNWRVKFTTVSRDEDNSSLIDHKDVQDLTALQAEGLLNKLATQFHKMYGRSDLLGQTVGLE